MGHTHSISRFFPFEQASLRCHYLSACLTALYLHLCPSFCARSIHHITLSMLRCWLRTNMFPRLCTEARTPLFYYQHTYFETKDVLLFTLFFFFWPLACFYTKHMQHNIAMVPSALLRKVSLSFSFLLLLKNYTHPIWKMHAFATLVAYMCCCVQWLLLFYFFGPIQQHNTT